MSESTQSELREELRNASVEPLARIRGRVQRTEWKLRRPITPRREDAIKAKAQASHVTFEGEPDCLPCQLLGFSIQ